MNLAALLQAIEANSIVTIDTRELDTPVDDHALEKIADALKNNESVTTIHVAGDLLSEKGILALCDPLKYNKKVISLSLNGIKNVKVWLMQVTEMLKSNRTIETLELNNNQITDEIFTDFADLLKMNFWLKHLHFENNQLTDISLKKLISAYNFCHQLTTLNLNNNKITDSGAKMFAVYLGRENLKNSKPLEHDPFITQINLDNNGITDSGVQIFVESLKQNHFLIELTLKNNPTTEKSLSGFKKIAEKLADNKNYLEQVALFDEKYRKIGEKPRGDSPGGIYLREDDDTAWLIKRNIGLSGRPERTETILEYVATKLIRLWIPDYPETILLRSGGFFYVGYRYIDNIMTDCNQFDSKKPILHLMLSYLMCYLLADVDSKENRWFFEKEQNIIFYKGDLEMAFCFGEAGSIERIDLDAISNQRIAEFFNLPLELVNRAITDENKIASLQMFLQVTNQQIIATCIELKLLEDASYVVKNVSTILQRAKDCRAAIPGLIKQIQTPIKYASLIQIPPGEKSEEEQQFSQQQTSQQQSSEGDVHFFHH